MSAHRSGTRGASDTRLTADASAGRRALLAALAGAAASATPGLSSAASAAPGGADAALIRACQAFEALEDRITAFYSGGATPIVDDDERDAAIAPLKARQRRLLNRICAVCAETLQGVNARARMTRRWEPALADDPGLEATWDQRLFAALLRDFAPAGAHD